MKKRARASKLFSGAALSRSTTENIDNLYGPNTSHLTGPPFCFLSFSSNNPFPPTTQQMICFVRFALCDLLCASGLFVRPSCLLMSSPGDISVRSIDSNLRNHSTARDEHEAGQSSLVAYFGLQDGLDNCNGSKASRYTATKQQACFPLSTDHSPRRRRQPNVGVAPWHPWD